MTLDMPESGKRSITVIIPFHNASRYPGACVRSLAASRHARHKLILVDDGSTDGARGTVESHAARSVGMHWLYYVTGVAACLAGYAPFLRNRPRGKRGGGN